MIKFNHLVKYWLIIDDENLTKKEKFEKIKQKIKKKRNKKW